MIILLPINCFIAGLNPLASDVLGFCMLPSGIIEALKLASFADGLGAVGGFSLKKITIMTATTIPMIAWHNKELKI